MLNDMAANLNRALTIARTEQLRAYRTAATEQMKASGVVEGWIWRSALQDRTCLACLAMDGQQFSLDEELTDHPNGRCFKQPIIKGLTPIAAKSGAEWFSQQSEETQRAMMGPKRYEAWKAGAFEFIELARRSESDVWGPSVRVAGIEEILSGQRGESIRTTGIPQMMTKSLGELDETLVSLLSDEVKGNLEVVLTARQREHFLERHGEMSSLEHYLTEAVLWPDEVHQNKSDPRMAIFYKRLDETHYLRVAVWVAPKAGNKKHSVISYRIAKEKEVIKGRSRRVRWEK